MCFAVGCSNSEENEISPILSGFTCEFTIESSGLSGELNVEKDGVLTICFIGDDIINGLKMQVKQESVTVDVNGITETYSRQEVPENSPAFCIYDALIASKQIKPKLSGDVFTLNGNSKSGNFSIKLNNSGFISEIALINSDTVFLLKNQINL
ncbi:MAG: hypothetical protein IIX60_05365 [Clostridia bacterium]|nr:hypothetical protein [Clostridia bacterium]